MARILKKKILGENVKLMILDVPHIAKKAKAGQFIILRVDEKGERIPLTIADHDEQIGTITIIFQEVGKTTMLLGELSEGDDILDVAGPLGKPSELSGYKRAAVVGGGLGCAIAYPQAKELYKNGTKVDIIAGFRRSELIILEEEMKNASDNLYICTEDGSKGTKGFVTDKLEELIKEGNNYDIVIAVGPLIMMKFVSLLTKKYNIKTVVSMNPIMIDGTGMCGGCRLTVDGKTRFACVDGPEFDGHKVDFDEAIRRTAAYKDFEIEAVSKHICRLRGNTNE